MNYYNDNDPLCVQWVRNLIAEGLLPEGEVDDRSIHDVQANDLHGYTGCHFFAGIGGWPLALSLARWPEDKEVWTGSCPCQPFSQAGKQRGEHDERHLWPEFRRLIAECRPSTVFGEQVASAAGREWLAGVRADLEGMGYAVGAADLCAAGVAAPHGRQRLWWVADTNGDGWETRESTTSSTRHRRTACANGGFDWVGDAGGERDRRNAGAVPRTEGECASKLVKPRRLADVPHAGESRGAWEPSDQIARWRVKPGVRLLADGIPSRVGRLRAYGNAIVPQVAAEFVAAVMECMP